MRRFAEKWKLVTLVILMGAMVGKGALLAQFGGGGIGIGPDIVIGPDIGFGHVSPLVPTPGWQYNTYLLKNDGSDPWGGVLPTPKAGDPTPADQRSKVDFIKDSSMPPQEKISLYRELAGQGNVEAKLELGLALLEAHPQDTARTQEAVKLLEEAESQGSAQARKALVEMAIGGRAGIPGSAEKVKEWVERGARLGDATSMVFLGRFYAQGLGGAEGRVVIPKDEAKAVEWLEAAAALGDATALDAVIPAYLYGGIVVKQNPGKAMELLSKASGKGTGEADYWLGAIYENGAAGQTKDLANAVRHYQLAAQKHNKKSLFRLGRLYETGVSGDGSTILKQDLEAALKLYREAAKSGLPEAQYKMGTYYENGTVVDQSPDKAFDYFNMAARNGVVEAQHKVGGRYLSGLGVNRDPVAAGAWLGRAALRGHVKSQVVFGSLCEESGDFSRAENLYTQAGETGSAEAMLRLASLYQRGFASGKEPGTEDLVMAYGLAQMAAKSAGDEDLTSAAVTFREVIGHQLTTSDRQAAERLFQASTEAVRVQDAPAKAGEDRFVGTPHLKVGPQDALQPDTEYELTVYIDKKMAVASEEVRIVSADFASPTSTELKLTAELRLSPHFQALEMPGEKELKLRTLSILRGARESGTVTFKVKTHGMKDFTGAAVHVTFCSSQLKAVGYVRREWDGKGVPLPLSVGEFSASAQEQTADLIIQVRRQDNQLYCTVRSPHLEEYQGQGRGEEWVMQRLESRVHGWMRDMMKAKAGSELLVLDSVGRALNDAAPKVVKDALWALWDQKPGQLKTILLVTEEPYFPWELLRPIRTVAGKEQKLMPLGAQFMLGRWILPEGAAYAPRQKLLLENSLIVKSAMDDDKDSAADKLADDEAKEVRRLMKGEYIDPATSDNVDLMLRQKTADILHFICHGRAEAPDAALGPDYRQILKLDGKTEIVDYTIRDIKGFELFFANRSPLVFLNACEVGQLESGLVGVGGFAAEFTKLRAGAVIAPLWSVRHQPAFAVARDFYQKLAEKSSVPMAEILRKIRDDAYQKAQSSGATAEDKLALITIMAYCFYGDPYCVREAR